MYCYYVCKPRGRGNQNKVHFQRRSMEFLLKSRGWGQNFHDKLRGGDEDSVKYMRMSFAPSSKIIHEPSNSKKLISVAFNSAKEKQASIMGYFLAWIFYNEKEASVILKISPFIFKFWYFEHSLIRTKCLVTCLL